MPVSSRTAGGVVGGVAVVLVDALVLVDVAGGVVVVVDAIEVVGAGALATVVEDADAVVAVTVSAGMATSSPPHDPDRTAAAIRAHPPRPFRTVSPPRIVVHPRLAPLHCRTSSGHGARALRPCLEPRSRPAIDDDQPSAPLVGLSEAPGSMVRCSYHCSVRLINHV
jgi:hypothetical protein